MQLINANTVNGTYTGPIVEINDKHVVQQLNQAARILHEREVLKEAMPELNQNVRIAYSANVPTVSAEGLALGKGIGKGLHV